MYDFFCKKCFDVTKYKRIEKNPFFYICCNKKKYFWMCTSCKITLKCSELKFCIYCKKLVLRKFKNCDKCGHELVNSSEEANYIVQKKCWSVCIDNQDDFLSISPEYSRNSNSDIKEEKNLDVNIEKSMKIDQKKE